MVDVTGVLDEDAPVNTFLTALVGAAVLVMASIVLFGFQLQDLGIIIAGLVFLPALLAADYFSTGRIVRSPGTFGALAAGYWLPVLFLAFNPAEATFSFFSAPSQSYLSAALADTSPALRAIINRWLAPIVENLLGIAITVLVYDTLREAFSFPKVPAIVVAAMPAALIFTRLHGIRGTEFQVLAFVMMLLWIVPVFIEDALPKSQVPVIPMSITWTIGLHRAINLSNGGGYLAFANLLLGAEPPLSTTGVGILFFELIALFGFLVWTVQTGRDYFG